MSVVAILTNFTSRSPEMMKVLDRTVHMLCLYDIELRLLYCDTESMPADWFRDSTASSTAAVHRQLQTVG